MLESIVFVISFCFLNVVVFFFGDADSVATVESEIWWERSGC